MKLLTILTVFFLLSCSSVTLPDNHYYRLGTSYVTVAEHKSNKKINVVTFKTEGMLGASNLLYSEQSRPNEILQYHYHKWHKPLSSLLTESLIVYLKNNFSRDISHYNYSKSDGYLIDALVNKMEIQYDSAGSRLIVSILITVSKDDNLLLNKTYISEKSYETKDIYQLVTNYNDVLKDIYSDLITDLNRL